GIFLLQQPLRYLIGGPNEFAVAGAALLNGLLFQPVRRWLQGRLYRGLHRRRYRAARALATFSSSLRAEEVELDVLEQRLLAAVQDTLHPLRMGLWLRERETH